MKFRYFRLIMCTSRSNRVIYRQEIVPFKINGPKRKFIHFEGYTSGKSAARPKYVAHFNIVLMHNDCFIFMTLIKQCTIQCILCTTNFIAPWNTVGNFIFWEYGRIALLVVLQNYLILKHLVGLIVYFVHENWEDLVDRVVEFLCWLCNFFII